VFTVDTPFAGGNRCVAAKDPESGGGGDAIREQGVHAPSVEKLPGPVEHVGAAVVVTAASLVGARLRLTALVAAPGLLGATGAVKGSNLQP
jgi:hypothetical protein